MPVNSALMMRPMPGQRALTPYQWADQQRQQQMQQLWEGRGWTGGWDRYNWGWANQFQDFTRNWAQQNPAQGPALGLAQGIQDQRMQQMQQMQGGYRPEWLGGIGGGYGPQIAPAAGMAPVGGMAPTLGLGGPGSAWGRAAPTPISSQGGNPWRQPLIRNLMGPRW